MPDDRSGVYIALLSAREAAGDDEGCLMLWFPFDVPLEALWAFRGPKRSRDAPF